jgi:hypothetical protein
MGQNRYSRATFSLQYKITQERSARFADIRSIRPAKRNFKLRRFFLALYRSRNDVAPAGNRVPNFQSSNQPAMQSVHQLNYPGSWSQQSIPAHFQKMAVSSLRAQGVCRHGVHLDSPHVRLLSAVTSFLNRHHV